MQLTKRKDGRWQYNKRINGVCKTFYSTEPNERRAEKDIEKQLLSFNMEDYRKKHNFMELAKQVIEEKSHTVQWTTIEMYEDAMNRLSDEFNTDIEKSNLLRFKIFSILWQKSNILILPYTKTKFSSVWCTIWLYFVVLKLLTQ